ncbi:MAG: hypothetical protein IPL61_01070 [Myxococcales bacterium]|nr:hypothetical protein [Myxococcales bacterium]
MRITTLLFTTTFAALIGGCDGSVADDGDQLICSAQLAHVGTTVLEAQPVGISGCWPVGTWTFTTTVTANACGSTPMPLAQYQIKIERDLAAEEPDHTFIYSYLTDPADTTAAVSVTSGGGGECEGEVLLFSPDGRKVWNMHPALQADGSLTGIGDYEEHSTSQIPL